MPNNLVNPSYSNWPSNQTNQIPQTGANMQGLPNYLFQVQKGNETMVIRQERYSTGRVYHSHMVEYRLVNGGNAGPLLVSVENPKLGLDNQERYGDVCPTCGKGILLLDYDCVREKSCGAECLVFLPLFCCILLPVISWPFVGGFCCYFRFCKKRLCTSCNAEYPANFSINTFRKVQ